VDAAVDLTPEDVLFGRTAMLLGLVRETDLLTVVAEQRVAGQWRPLGEILVEKRVLTGEHVQLVLRTLGQSSGPAPTAPLPAASPGTAPPTAIPAAPIPASPASTPSPPSVAPGETMQVAPAVAASSSSPAESLATLAHPSASAPSHGVAVDRGTTKELTSDDVLFGRTAMSLGFVREADLLAIVDEQRATGQWRRLGEMLVEKGLLSIEQVHFVLHTQEQLRAQVASTSPAATIPAPVPAATTPVVSSPAPSSSPTISPPQTRTVTGTMPVVALTAATPVAVAPTAASAVAVVSSTKSRAGLASVVTIASGPPTGPLRDARIVSSPNPDLAWHGPAQLVQAMQQRFEVAVGPVLADRAVLHHVLREAVRVGASDVHFHTGTPVRFRIGGVLRPVAQNFLPDAYIGAAVLSALDDEEQLKTLQAEGELDFSYAAPDVGRFRVNLFKQQFGFDAVFRVVSPVPPRLEELGLPADLGRLADHHQGIVLFTGPAGCGKSSTMGAVLNLVNEQRSDHILMLEDPTETIHADKLSLVNQRQVKQHTTSFARALKAALREDPDVIVIGELRDYETISLAISAAETGHLVMGTLHTSSAIRTINRILGVFPPAQQAQVRSMVAESLRAIVSQRLVVRADGKGRVPALEILHINAAVANLIRENRTLQIKSVLQTGTGQGMTSLDNSLEILVKNGTITKEEAQKHAEDPKKFMATTTTTTTTATPATASATTTTTTPTTATTTTTTR
jgi:twitching motility protein PilT